MKNRVLKGRHRDFGARPRGDVLAARGLYTIRKKDRFQSKTVGMRHGDPDTLLGRRPGEFILYMWVILLKPVVLWPSAGPASAASRSTRRRPTRPTWLQNGLGGLQQVATVRWPNAAWRGKADGPPRRHGPQQRKGLLGQEGAVLRPEREHQEHLGTHLGTGGSEEMRAAAGTGTRD